MLLRLNHGDASPLYQQIAAAVRRAVADGELAPGERLPPARELAGSLEVNVHTVLRGIAELEREGLVRVRRGRGVTVCTDSAGRARLQQLLREVVDEASRLGVGESELIASLRELT